MVLGSFMVRSFVAVLCSLALIASPGRAGAQQESTPAIADSVVAPPARVLTLDLTRDANDIWDRIRRGFGMPDLDSDRVSDQQAFYLNRPNFLKQVFARGGRYLYYIVDELERRGMPTELALLPMVESSYNPMALSHAQASGLWQFIPSTGKAYNLTQDAWVDERRDVIASTQAALDYLQNIYEMHGDWHLALASYNWGEGSVQRALKRNHEQGLPLEYRHLQMPEETRNYVPRLQAIKNIVAEPELFHFELPYVANEMHFVAVEVPVGVDLATAARLAGLPLEEFIALNPSFNRPATTSPGQTLIVPTDRASRLRAGLEELESKGKSWKLHTVGKGESLAQIASRHDLSVSELRNINGLPSNQVSSGQRLLVPAGIDPAGALQVSRMLPLATGNRSAPGLRPGSRGSSGLQSSASPRRAPPATGKAKPGTAKKAPATRKPAATRKAPARAPAAKKAKPAGAR